MSQGPNLGSSTVSLPFGDKHSLGRIIGIYRQKSPPITLIEIQNQNGGLTFVADTEFQAKKIRRSSPETVKAFIRGQAEGKKYFPDPAPDRSQIIAAELARRTKLHEAVEKSAAELRTQKRHSELSSQAQGLSTDMAVVRVLSRDGSMGTYRVRGVTVGADTVTVGLPIEGSSVSAFPMERVLSIEKAPPGISSRLGKVEQVIPMSREEIALAVKKYRQDTQLIVTTIDGKVQSGSIGRFFGGDLGVGVGANMLSLSDTILVNFARSDEIALIETVAQHRQRKLESAAISGDRVWIQAGPRTIDGRVLDVIDGVVHFETLHGEHVPVPLEQVTNFGGAT